MSRAARETGIPLPGLAPLLLALAAGVAGWMIWQSARERRLEADHSRRMESLFDEDASFREHVRSVDLWAEEGADALPELLAEIENESPKVRRAVVLAIGRTPRPAADTVAAVLGRLDDPEIAVRRTALSVLSGWIERQELDGAPYVSRILRMLEEPDASIHQDVVAISMRVQATSIERPELVRLLKSAAPHARQAAALLLQTMAADAESLAALRDLLRDTDPDVRDAAFEALASFGAVTRDEAIAALDSRNGLTRQSAYQVLTVFGPRAAPAIARLRELLPVSEDSNSVLELLAAIGVDAEPAVPDLLALLEGIGRPDGDQSPESYELAWKRAAALKCLSQISSDEMLVVSMLREDLHSTHPQLASRVAATLAKRFPDDARMEVVRLLERLQHERDPLPRRDLVIVLGSLGTAASAAVPALTGLIDGPDPAVAWHAIRALGEIGPAAAPCVPALVARLPAELPTSPSIAYESHTATFGALRRIGVRSAVDGRRIADLIDRALDDWQSAPEPSHSLSSVVEPTLLLAQTGVGQEPAHQVLSRALQLQEQHAATSGLSRSQLLLALAELRVEPDTTCELLLAELRNPGVGATDVVRGLVFLPECAERSVPVLIDLLDSSHPQLQLAVIEVLGELGPAAEAAVPDLQRVVDSPSIFNPQWWQSAHSELETIWARVGDLPEEAQVVELAALPLAVAARDALDRIRAAARPVSAPRPE